MTKYTNITFEEYNNLSYKERKLAYCIEYIDGTQKWVANELLHREDGPAIIYYDGSSIIYYGGSEFWCLLGIQYSFEEWFKKTPLSDEEKVFLRLKYS